MNNMERLPADTFFLDLELRQEVERMASLGYAPDDIASYLGLDAESFVFDAGREGTTVYSLMRRGALKAGAGVELKLQEQALSGDLDAMELLEKTGVMVTPGSAFGPSGEGHVRMALVQDEEVIREALQSIKESGILNL